MSSKCISSTLFYKSMIKKVPENWETLAKYPFKIKLIAEFD